MRIMIDTNVLISAFVLSSPHMQQLVNLIAERHTIVLPTYVLEELKLVVQRKFPDKTARLETFLQELPYELAYTPQRIDSKRFPIMRDAKDLPVLVTAILENVDILLTGDADFADVSLSHPEVLTPRMFMQRYGA